jgi:ABC-type phosphate/phosphonate transport system substrate-binding protein
VSETLLLGAVAYDPKVVTIWEGFKSWFETRGLPFDAVLYTNYERMVEALLDGEIDVAWNSPLAWIEAERGARLRGTEASALAMRDTDQDLTSVIVVRQESPIGAIPDLRGKRVAAGAADSPQATLIPLEVLAREGLAPAEYEVVRHDVLVGKHGDHIGGEREAARDLAEGRAEAACMIDSNHLLFAREGVLPPGSTRILAQTPPYDHCNFTALSQGPRDLLSRFRRLLLGMSYDDPAVRPLLDLEGLKSWKEARTTGYRLLNDAVDRFGTVERWLEAAAGAARASRRA